MPKKKYVTRFQDQAVIAQQLGPARIQAAKDRLCNKCFFKEWHESPCRLLPLDSEGKDCPYFKQGD